MCIRFLVDLYPGMNFFSSLVFFFLAAGDSISNGILLFVRKIYVATSEAASLPGSF